MWEIVYIFSDILSCGAMNIVRNCISDRLCGPVVRVPSYQIFREVMGLERSPLSFMSTTEELLDRKVAAPV
jgi:hypothetical protein